MSFVMSHKILFICIMLFLLIFTSGCSAQDIQSGDSNSPSSLAEPAPASTSAPEPAQNSTKQSEQAPASKTDSAPAPSPAPTPASNLNGTSGSIRRSSSGDLSKLPTITVNSTTKELKASVSKIYDQFPQFKNLYETKMGMTKNQALAFMFADMSRESGKDGKWQVDLLTGGGPAKSWGPFQAAVTNFNGGGYDKDILNALGMPTPDISQFKNPSVSTYAGMRRLAEGAALAMKAMGAGKPYKEYLLGSMAHHNTGHVSAANDAGWRQGYGDETLRLMGGYLTGGHLTDDKAYWTGQAL